MPEVASQQSQVKKYSDVPKNVRNILELKLYHELVEACKEEIVGDNAFFREQIKNERDASIAQKIKGKLIPQAQLESKAISKAKGFLAGFVKGGSFISQNADNKISIVEDSLRHIVEKEYGEHGDKDEIDENKLTYARVNAIEDLQAFSDFVNQGPTISKRQQKKMARGGK